MDGASEHGTGDHGLHRTVSGDGRLLGDAGHSGTGRTLTLTGLTAGTAYEVRVQATNAEGTSAWSAAATATTTAAPNEAPTFSSPDAFSVAENTTAAGTVTATDADADDSVTGYTITGGADRAKFSITNTARWRSRARRTSRHQRMPTLTTPMSWR